MESALGIVSFFIEYWPAIKAALALASKLKGNGHPDPANGAADLIRSAHKMTPAEEQAWFDRASRSDNGGA